MKIRILAIAILVSSIVSAQEKKIHFDKKISYKMNMIGSEAIIDTEELNGYTYSLYLNKEGYSLIESKNFTGKDLFYTLLKDGKSLNIYINPINKKVESEFDFYSFNNDPVPFIPLEKTSNKEIILNRECNYYNLSTENTNNNSVSICIDESSKINNAYVFFNSPVKGLVLAINYSNELKLVLNEVVDADFELMFDFDKTYNQHQKQFNEMTESNTTVSPSDEFTDDFPTDEGEFLTFTENYHSNYKDVIVDEVSLAYSNLEHKYKISAPKYCEDLFTKIPDFSNKQLKHHVYNYAGQICDLYIYNNGGEVDYISTIDSMRKSLLEIEKMRSSLSNKDSELLLQFIKGLD